MIFLKLFKLKQTKAPKKFGIWSYTPLSDMFKLEHRKVL